MRQVFPMNPKAKTFFSNVRYADRKRTFNLSVVTVPKMNTASYWSGGSRSYYTVINLKTGAETFPPEGKFPMFQAEYTLQPGEFMLEGGLCCGNTFAPTVFCLPEDENQVRSKFGLPLVLTGVQVEVAQED